MPTKKTVYFKPAIVRAFKNSSQVTATRMRCQNNLLHQERELDVFNLEARAICTISQDLPGQRPVILFSDCIVVAMMPKQPHTLKDFEGLSKSCTPNES